MTCTSQNTTDLIVQALYATGVELTNVSPQCAAEREFIDDELRHLSAAIECIRAHDAECAASALQVRSR